MMKNMQREKELIEKAKRSVSKQMPMVFSEISNRSKSKYKINLA